MSVALVKASVLLALLATASVSAQLGGIVGGFQPTNRNAADVKAVAKFCMSKLTRTKANSIFKTAPVTLATKGGIVSARKQIVAGANYDLKLKVIGPAPNKKTLYARCRVFRNLQGKFSLTSLGRTTA